MVPAAVPAQCIPCPCLSLVHETPPLHSTSELLVILWDMSRPFLRAVPAGRLQGLGFLVLASQSVMSEESPDNDKELKPSSLPPVFSRSSTGTPSKFLMIFFTLSPVLPGSSSVSRQGSGAPLLLSAAGVVCPYCCGSGCQGWHSGSG